MTSRARRLIGGLLALSLATGPAAQAQEWLLGKRRPDTPEPVKVLGSYRSGDRVRVKAGGGAFDRLGDVSRAALDGLADLAKARGKPRFAVTKDRCWLPLAQGASCVLDAVMLDAGQPAPAGTDPRKVFDTADLPAAH